MKFKRWVAFVLLVAAGSLIAHAEEGGEGKKEESSAADKPWNEVQNRISSLSTRTHQSEEKLHELIEEKKKTTSNERMHELDKEIDATYKEYKNSSEELRRQEQIFKYRFPERAAKAGERVYHTQEVPSLDKIEEQVGIDGKLHRNMVRMRSQYGTAAKKAKEAAPIATPVPEPGQEEKNILEQDSPILKK